jgi:hypothetical protein
MGMMVHRRVMAGLLLAYGMLASASAQSPQKVPGSWFAGDDRFGLTVNKNDAQPSFAYGDCDRRKSRPQARLNLRIDPRQFGDALAMGKHIIVRWTNSQAQGNLSVEGLRLNESGQYLRSILLAVELETLDQWREPSRLQLTPGLREVNGPGFVWRRGYLMPDHNRKKAMASFISSCSGGAHH